MNLTDYYNKVFEFLFSSPLYKIYTIDTKIRSISKEEILEEATEDRAPDILNHDIYKESLDFAFLKTLAFLKTEVYEYCPVCKKESIIYLKGKETPNELSGEIIDTYSYMYASEEIDIAYDFALKKWEKRVKYFVDNYLDNNGNFTVTSTCKNGHRLQSVFHITDDFKLIKIGQFPARAEFEDFIKKYKKILSKEDYKELNIAIGLASHGIGAGAFVYLRRIFERLIFKVFNEQKVISREEFTNKKMEDKLKSLDIYFDDNINKNMLYGILSKGIHELSDDDCKENFTLVLKAILIILEKWLENKRKEENHEVISKLINDVGGKLKKK